MKRFLLCLLMVLLLVTALSSCDDSTDVAETSATETSNVSEDGVKKPALQDCVHIWDEGKVTKEPTEEEEGVKTFTCTVCGETKTEAIDKLVPEEPPAEECKHEEQVLPGKAATCTETGLTEGKKCTVCGEWIVEQEIIPFTHDEEIIPGKAATCTETGLTEGKKCSVCGEILVEQVEISITHAYDNGVITGMPIENEFWVVTKTCTLCGDVITEQTTSVLNIPSTLPEPIYPENNSTDGSTVLLVSGGTAQFTIVSNSPEYDDTAVLLASKLREKFGVIFTSKPSSQKNKVTGKKIIIGKPPKSVVTNYADLSYLGLLFSNTGSSINITGHLEETVLAAVDRFIAIDFSPFISQDANGKTVVAVPSSVLNFMAVPTNYINPNPTLFGVPLSQYSIVVPQTMSATEKFCITQLIDEIGRYSGVYLTTKTDKKAATAYEIVFGNTNRAVSQSLYETLADGSYAMKSESGKLYLAYSDYTISEATRYALHLLYLSNIDAADADLTINVSPDPNTRIEKTEDTDVRVMSSNIVCAADANGIKDIETPYGITWQERIAIVTREIMLYLPDFVGMQEIQNGTVNGIPADMFSEILANVGSEYAFVVYNQMKDAPGAYWNPILYRKTVWQIEAQDVLYPGDFDNAMHRWQWALFSKIDDPSQKYIVINLHNPTRSGNLPAQLEAADIVNAKILELKELYPDIPIILTGDFNTEKDTETYNRTIANTDIRTSYSVTDDVNEIAEIDHIMVATDLLNVIAYRKVNGDYMALTSDHRPIFADLSLKNKSNSLYLVDLVKDGSAQYTIVSSSAEYDDDAAALAAALLQKTGISFPYRTSAQQNSVTGKKIILGKDPTNLLLDATELAPLGVLCIDRTNSIHLTGYAEETVAAAIERLLSIDFAAYLLTDTNGNQQLRVPSNVLFFLDNSAMDEVDYWVPLVKDGVAQYTIVSSDEAYDVAAINLSKALADQIGVTFSYKTSAYQTDASGKKIVLGKAPNKIVSDVSFLAYRGLLSIDRGLSIHVTGHTEESALAAIERFMSINFALFKITNEQGKIDISMPDSYLFFVDNNQYYPNPNPTILGKDLAEYKIVVSKNMTAAEKFMLQTLLAKIGDTTGYMLSYVTDAKAQAEYEIVFGNTKRAGSQALYAELGEGEFILRSIDGSIYIAYDNYLVADNAAAEFHKLYQNDTASSIDLKKTPDYSSYAIEKAADTDVRVMTSNIICAGDSYSKEQYEGVYGISWQERVNIQGEMMLLYLPDFVGLQEMQEGDTYGWALMHTQLLKKVKSEYSFVTYDGMAQNTYWNPILYRHTVWNLTAKGTMYPGNFDDHMHRWQWALFTKIDDPSQQYILLNLHYPTSRNQTAQQAAADIVNAKIRELKALYPNVPIFVTGDFNAAKTTTTFQKTVANTDLVTSFDLTSNRNTIASIDHILVPTDLAEVLSYRVIVDHYIALSSDHRPAFADISLKS